MLKNVEFSRAERRVRALRARKCKMQRAKGKMQNERARRRNSALLKAYKTTVCRRRFSFCKIFLIFLKNFYFSGRAKKNDVILWIYESGKRRDTEVWKERRDRGLRSLKK